MLPPRPINLSKSQRLPKLSAARCAGVLLLTFVVLLPKGGFKVGPIPITWGYILIGFFTLLSVPYAILDRRRNLIPTSAALLLAFLVPFQCILLISIAQGFTSFGVLSAALTDFVLLPYVFVFVWRRWYTKETLSWLLPFLRFCIFAAASYGIFLFFWRLATGKFIEIPYLTVNVGDVGTIASKDNLRGGLIMKLVSTYNNGNVYGAATILLLPIFDCIETKKLNKALLRLALFLTLSRTAWFGILVDQLLTTSSTLIASLKHFPYLEVSEARKSVLSGILILGIGVVIICLALWLPGGASMLVDQSLNGRSAQLEVFSHFSLLPHSPFDGFLEMVFPSALRQFGLVGFVSMLLLFLSPLGFGIVDRSLRRSRLRKAAVKGLLLYFVIAWIDGAIDFIPVMAFYWFVVALAIYGDGIDTTATLSAYPSPIQF